MIQCVQEWLKTERVFTVVVALGLFTMAARNVTDPDVWWHLRTGELIAHTHHVPRTDPFSFTRSGQRWINHEWLSDLLIYGFYRIGGWVALIVVFAALTSAALLLAYARSPGRPYIAGAITVFGAVASAPTWGVRPQTISLLLASTFLLLLDRAENHRNLIWWTIPLTLLWVNLHAGFMIGIFFLVLFILGEVSDVLFGRRLWPAARGRVRDLCLATTGCIAVVPLNPNGIRMYAYPFVTLHSAAMQNYISEWFSPNFHQHRFMPLLLFFLVMIASLSLLKQQPRPRDLVLLIATLWGALQSIRHIPLFILVAIPILSGAIQFWMTPHSDKVQRTPDRAIGMNAVALAAFAVFTIARVWTVAEKQGAVEAQHFPAAAVAFISSHHPPAPMLAHYNWGGYFIWKLYPEYRVFIDGRADLYGDAFMDEFRDLYYLKGNGEQALGQWEIRTVVLPPDAPLLSALRINPSWSEIYRDSMAVVFARH